jgi:hypothetical protein
VLCVALVLALALASAGQAASRKRAPLSPLQMSVTFDAAHPLPLVPPDFLGFSFELSSLPLVGSYASHGDLVALLRSLGAGVLRFGGASADTRAAWTDQHTPLPAWASAAVRGNDYRAIASLAGETGWRVLLTLGLGHFEPEAAARAVAAAKAALGGWLQAIELGNEPNAYALQGLRPEPWTFVQYDAQVAAYRSAIEAAAPGIPLAGPDTSGSSAFENWGPGETVNQRPALLTGHHYALRCNQQPAPTIARLLSPQTRRLEEASLLRYVTTAEQGETPFRLDETNNVSCGGVAGISDTFASALWAAGYLTRAMALGVTGVNLHGIFASCAGYAPFCAPTSADLDGGALSVQPEWYALRLIKPLVGESPLPTKSVVPAHHDALAYTALAPNGTLHVVIVDDDAPGARSLLVRVRVGRAFGAARVLWLTAPSPGALAGMRLGGRAIAPNGAWSPPPKLPRVADERGVISVHIWPSSACLLTVAATSQVGR